MFSLASAAAAAMAKGSMLLAAARHHTFNLVITPFSNPLSRIRWNWNAKHSALNVLASSKTIYCEYKSLNALLMVHAHQDHMWVCAFVCEFERTTLLKCSVVILYNKQPYDEDALTYKIHIFNTKTQTKMRSNEEKEEKEKKMLNKKAEEKEEEAGIKTTTWTLHPITCTQAHPNTNKCVHRERHNDNAT